MIVLYLEYDLNLSLLGNGWLDGDDEMEDIINDDRGLLSKMRILLNPDYVEPNFSDLDAIDLDQK